MFRLLLWSLQCLAALGAPWNPQGIAPTPSIAGPPVSPKITSAPRPAIVDHGLYRENIELKKRDYGDLCGYASLDNEVYSVTCAVGDRCAINTNYNSYAMGCCPFNDFQNCVLPTQCLGYGELSSCDDSCASNYFIAKCTSTEYPHCATYRSIHNGYTLDGYECAEIQTLIAVTESSADGVTSTPAVVDSSPTASPVPAAINNYINNSNTTNNNNNKTEVNPPDDKNKLSKGELAGVIVGSITGVVTVIGVLIACCKGR